MFDSKITYLVTFSVMTSLTSGLSTNDAGIPVLPEETDGTHFVTIPPSAAGTFKWPYYDNPRIIIINKCTVPITVRLLLDEGACVAQVYRGSHYSLFGTGVGDFMGGGGGEHTITICDDDFSIE